MTNTQSAIAVIVRFVAVAIAVAAMVAAAEPGFAREVGTIDVPGWAHERTEGDKFANEYGYADSGRTPEDASIHLEAARLARTRDITATEERTEGERFAQDYGYLEPAAGGDEVGSAPASEPGPAPDTRETVALIGSVMLLLMAAGLLAARRHRTRSAI